MSPEKELKLLNKIVQQIVGAVTFAEIVKIIHSLAQREAETQLNEFTEKEKEETYNELFPSEAEDLSKLPSEKAPAE